jgi:DNA-binding YbaB/EbfC family protein
MKDLNDILGMASRDSIEVEGVAGGGLVRVRASAKGRIIGLSVDDSLIVPADKGIMEDLIVAAFNDARVKADEVSGQEMAKLTAGLPLPPGFKLPF